MYFFDKDVKSKSTPKEHSQRLAEMRKKNINRCARVIREVYKNIMREKEK